MTAPTARHLHGHRGWLYTSWSRHGDISATRISGHTWTDARGRVSARIAAVVRWRGGVHHICFRTDAPLYQSQLTGDGTPGSAVLAEYYRWEMKKKQLNFEDLYVVLVQCVGASVHWGMTNVSRITFVFTVSCLQSLDYQNTLVSMR